MRRHRLTGSKLAVHRLAYAAIALSAVVVCAMQAWRQIWIGDFWDHAAVVRELAAHPWHPSHPMLAIEAPHAFFSPYHLALGFVCHLTGASCVTVLAITGIFCLVFLFRTLRRLLVRALPNGETVAPLALLFILLLWGKGAWIWSGFLHLYGLGFVAPYPSTLAAGVVFWGLSLWLDVLKRGSVPGWRRPAAAALLITTTLLVHPPTAAALLVLLGAAFISRADRRWAKLGLVLSATVAVAFLLAAAWPYYSLRDLVGHQSADFTLQSAVLYDRPWVRAWPALVALPLCLWRLRTDHRDFLAVATVILLSVYVLGYITGALGVGRLVAWIAMFSQVSAAAWCIEMAPRLGRRWRPAIPSLAAIAAALFLWHSPDPIKRITGHRVQQDWQKLQIVLAPVADGDVVLASLDLGAAVPALAGRVIATRRPLYWVPDHDERRAALKRFFAPSTSDDERRRIIQRYNARWLLIDERLAPSNEELTRLHALGHMVMRYETLALLACGEGVT